MVCISSLSPRSIESLVLDIRGLEQLASTASSPSKIFGLVDGNRSLERQVQQDVLKISRAQNASDLMARDVTHVGRAFSDKVSLSPGTPRLHASRKCDSTAPSCKPCAAMNVAA